MYSYVDLFILGNPFIICKQPNYVYIQRDTTLFALNNGIVREKLRDPTVNMRLYFRALEAHSELSLRCIIVKQLHKSQLTAYRCKLIVLFSCITINNSLGISSSSCA